MSLGAGRWRGVFALALRLALLLLLVTAFLRLFTAILFLFVIRWSWHEVSGDLLHMRAGHVRLRACRRSLTDLVVRSELTCAVEQAQPTLDVRAVGCRRRRKHAVR